MNKPQGITMQCFDDTHNQHICAAFRTTLEMTLTEFTRSAIFRVDLRQPHTESDAPSVFFDGEPDVITRFIKSLKAQLQAHAERLSKKSKRVYPNRLRYLSGRDQTSKNTGTI